MKLPSIDVIRLRHAAAKAMREFFCEQEIWEVDTPVRIPAPAAELHIVAEPAGTQYLRTSPELHMKRMLAAGAKAIYQLGPCFRANECGSRHRPEFSMLEWYRRDVDYMAILADIQSLIPHIAHAIQDCMPALSQNASSPFVPAALAKPWDVYTIREIYCQRAGWDPVVDFDPDRFDLDMINIIEPSLPKNRFTILTDYPIQVAALARRKANDPRVAERWELYGGGLELANAFSELTDPTEQRIRFEEALIRKKEIGEPIYSLDEHFLSALEKGLPPCAGVALGFDRLLMALTNAQDIAEVLPFPNK